MGSAASPSHEPQHIQALKYANHVRTARSELKRKIASGERSVPQVLVACPSHAATMSIGELLTTQKWWGSERSRRLLVATGVSERTSISNLTERQRTAIAALLELRAGRPNDGVGLEAPSRPSHVKRGLPHT
jgi:hypothetical protein